MIRRILLASITLFIVNFCSAQLPIVYYSCETVPTSGTYSAAPTLSVVGSPSNVTLAAGGTGANYCFGCPVFTGAGTTHSGTSAGYALSASGWPTGSSDPTTTVSPGFVFNVSTLGFSNISLTFDTKYGNANSPQYVGVLISSTGAAGSWTFVGSSTTSNGNAIPVFNSGGWSATVANFNLSAASAAIADNNNGSLYIKIYGYNSLANGSGAYLAIDNITVLAGSTVAGNSFTTMNETALYAALAPSAGAGPIARNSFTATGAGTNVTINTTSGLKVASGQTFSVTGGAKVTCSSSGIISGSGGIFTIASGCTLVTTNSGGIGGSITCTGTNVYNAGANYTFNAATTTPFAPSGTWQNPGNITINPGSGSSVTLNSSINMTGTLALTGGTLILGSYNLNMGPSSTVSGTLSSANMVVANSTGQLQKQYSSTGTFTYPVGDNSGNYTPISLNFTAGTFGAGAYAGVNLTKLKHPNNTNTTDYLNRYWSVNTSNITSPTITATATCIPADASGTEANVSMGMYPNALPWTKFAAISGNTLTATGATPSGTAFQFSGISTAGPSFSVNSPTICAGISTALTVSSPTRDVPFTYTWSPATALSATTGSSVNTTAGSTSVYSVTMTDGNGFTVMHTSTVTMNPSSPAPITGTFSACAGTNTLLGDITASGTWSSVTTGVATINATSGLVYAVSAGTSLISYNTGTCAATATVTVGAAPSTISGTLSVCPGSTTALTADISGGSWSTGGAGHATINSSTGVVTGVSTGSETIYYTTSGCNPISTTVNVLSGPTLAVTATGCAPSASLTASGATTYRWSPVDGTLSATSGATVSASPTSAIEIYTVIGTLGTCTATLTSTVYPTPATISGPNNICPSGTTNFTDATVGGTWSSADNTIATVNSSGLVTGVANGTINISYSFSACPTFAQTRAVTVGVLPITISNNWGCSIPPAVVLSQSWESGFPGSGWTNSNGTDWYIQSAGGSANFSSPTPATAPDGSHFAEFDSYNVTSGGSAYLTSPSFDLTNAYNATLSFWMYRDSYSSASYTDRILAYIGTSTNIATATLLTTIYREISRAPTVSTDGWYQYTYTIPGSFNGSTNYIFFKGISNYGYDCFIDNVQVTKAPTITFSDASTGGTWTSSVTTVAPIVSSTGVASLLANGTTVISYSVGGCTSPATTTFNVISATPAITGGTSVCTGSTLTLSDIYSGGSWSSSDVTKATVSSTGVVTGVAGGSVTITYSLGCGTDATYNITVVPPPSTISGTAISCSGSAGTTLVATPVGYTWSSSNPTVATVSSSGVVTPLSGGTTTINYSTGCGTDQTKVYTVNATPVAIGGGSASICTLSTTPAFTDATTGTSYVWSNTPTTVGTINAVTGVFTSSATTGSTTINYAVSYASGPSCSTTVNLGVSNTPPTNITGTLSVCTGASTLLTGTPSGGSWNVAAGSTSIASVNAATGSVTGLTAGTAVISYNSCGVLTRTVTVNGTSGSISSSSPVCVAGTLNLYSSGISPTPTTYSWTGPNGFSSATANPTASGVSSLSAGNYSLNATYSGCTRTFTTAVAISPVANYTLTGSATSICSGGNVSLNGTIVSTTPSNILTESWETGVPGTAGWYCSDATGWFQTGSSGTTYPTIASIPNGTQCAEFNSYSYCSGSAYLMSPNIDLSNWSTVTVSFYMYRDNVGTYGGSGYPEAIQVLVGTSTDIASATSLGTIYRSRALAPIVGSNGWYQYSFSIPNTFSGSTNYIFFNGITACGNNIYIDYIQLQGYQIFTPAWTPTTGLYTNSLLSSPYTGGTVTPVFASPSSTTTYYAMEGGCTSPTGVTVTVNPIPTATVTATAPSTYGLCQGTTVQLQSVTTGGAGTATYSWTGPGLTATTGTATAPSFTKTLSTVPTSGTGQYRMTISYSGSGCGSISATPSPVYTVAAAPTNPTFNTISSPSTLTLCNGTTVTLGATLTGGGTAFTPTYTWSGPGITTGTGTSTPTYTTSVASTQTGYYSVSVTYANATGCNGSAHSTGIYTVNPIPYATITGSATTCGGSTPISVAGGAPYASVTLSPSGSILLDGSGNGSTNVSPSVTTNYTGSITYSSSTGCAGTVSGIVTINVITTPAATINGSAITCGGATPISVVGGTPGGLITLSPGGSSFYLDGSGNGSINVSPSSNTTYTGTVSTGSGSCPQSASGSAVITVNAIPSVASITPSLTNICTGTPFTLTGGTTSGTGSLVSYNWTGPNGYSTTSTTNVVTVNPASTLAAGSYSLSVTYPNSGCTSIIHSTSALTVNTAPTLSGASTDGAICAGGTLNLHALSPANVAGYSWTGPVTVTSPTSVNATVPAATTAATGVYSVTVNNGGGTGCSAVYTATGTVNATPTASPTNGGAICNGGTINLYANPAGGATVYTWSGSSLASTTLLNPTANPSGTGTYVYSLTVSSGAASGCSPATVYTTSVTVNSTPTAAPSNGGAICNGGTISLYANPAGGTTGYTWSGSSLGSTSIQNPSATPSGAGTYVYSLTVSSGAASGCSPSTVYTTSVTVNSSPSASPTNGGTICNGGTLNLYSNPAGGATTYLWSGTGLSSTSLQNPTASPSGAGTYVYSLTVSSGGASGCSPSSIYTTSVTVNTDPTTTGATFDNTCLGGNLALHANASSATGYSWVGPAGFASTLSDPIIGSVSTSSNGIYTITISNGGGSGCILTYNTSAISLLSVPTVASVTPSLSAFCLGNSLTLTSGTVTGTGSPTYFWSGPGGYSNSSGTPSITFTPTVTTSGGTYSLMVTYPGNGCNSSTVTTAPINIAAQPSISSLTASSVGTVCSGVVENLAVSVSGGFGTPNYSWAGPGIISTTSTGAITSYSVIPSGPAAAYTVTVTYTVTGCNTAQMTTATVSPTPQSWLGVTSTDWNTGSNWSCGYFPVATDSVLIPFGTTFAPVIGSGVTGSLNNLKISNGVTLTVSAGGNLYAYGNIYNNGIVTGDGLIHLAGTTSQRLKGNGIFSNMELNNTAGAVIANASDTVLLTGKLVLTAGNFNTNNNLVLAMSDDSFGYPVNGRIDPIYPGGGSITGRVIDQQYVKGGRRAWRLWGHPFVDSIPLSQMENYIDITGMQGSSHGFTTTATNNPSAYWYHTVVSNSGIPGAGDPGWKPFTWCKDSMIGSTWYSMDSNLFHRFQGIKLFIRGALGEGLDGSPSYTIDPVNIRMWGNVNTGDMFVPLQKGATTYQDYNLVANPYPSPVDIGAVIHNAYQLGLLNGPFFWINNAFGGTTGTFIAVDETSYTPFVIPANTSVEVRAGVNGATLNFTEGHKSATPNYELLKMKPNTLQLTVYDNNYHFWDELNFRFDDNATDNEDSKFDGGKPINPDLNFYSWSADRHPLSADVRPYQNGKVIPLGIYSNYLQEFIIKVDNYFVPENGQVYLHDKYLDKYVLLSQGTEYKFAITKEQASQGDNRFELGLAPSESPILNDNDHFKILVLPNHASSSINLTFSTTNTEIKKVRILSVEGTVVYSKELGTAKNGDEVISIENLASGVYMVEFESGKDKVVKRLVKE